MKTCGTAGDLDEQGQQIGCLCYMPIKAKLAKEECWYFVKTGRTDMGWPMFEKRQITRDDIGKYFWVRRLTGVQEPMIARVVMDGYGQRLELSFTEAGTASQLDHFEYYEVEPPKA